MRRYLDNSSCKCLALPALGTLHCMHAQGVSIYSPYSPYSFSFLPFFLPFPPSHICRQSVGLTPISIMSTNQLLRRPFRDDIPHFHLFSLLSSLFFSPSFFLSFFLLSFLSFFSLSLPLFLFLSFWRRQSPLPFFPFTA
jgi:hypothetical protein